MIISCSKEESKYHPTAEKVTGEWKHKTNSEYTYKITPSDSTVYVFKNGTGGTWYKFYFDRKTGDLYRSPYTMPSSGGNQFVKQDFFANDNYTEINFGNIPMIKQ